MDSGTATGSAVAVSAADVFREFEPTNGHFEVDAVVIRFVMPDKLLVNDTLVISNKRGNGLIRRQIWICPKGKVTRYSLAYINQRVFAGDNGRVLGYDNAHNYHHRHFMGKIEPIDFVNFEDIEERFQTEWLAYRGAK